MALDYDRLMALDFAPRPFSWDAPATQRYALAVGLGRDMPADLPFVYELGAQPLQALPTLATVIAWEDTWQENTGMDVTKIVHGEQRVTLHRPLAAAGEGVARLRIADVFDKGAGRGAVLLAETTLADADGTFATLLSTVFARGDGGFGGPAGRGPEPHAVPTRSPDESFMMAVRPEQALHYRLCGDRNPLHADPRFARAAGFDRPVLHGLCTYGMAAAALVKTACAHDAARLTHIEARFTAPVFPGETLVTDLWMDAGTASFRTRVAERGAVVLDHGLAHIAPLS